MRLPERLARMPRLARRMVPRGTIWVMDPRALPEMMRGSRITEPTILLHPADFAELEETEETA